MDNSTLIQSKSSLLPTITECHAKRLGWARTLAGGFSMYLSIPFWILCHITVATVLYQVLIRPIFKTKRLAWSNYVILDRHRIEGLVAIDKFNCLFCGYANGLTTMINQELDQLNHLPSKLSTARSILSTISSLIILPFALVGDFLCLRLNYDKLIAPLLGMHTTNYSEIQNKLLTDNWGKNLNPLARVFFIYTKNVFTRIELLLEQIESSWCPLYHLEHRTEVVYPKHHQHFFQKEELDKMRDVLSTTGSVSPRQPKPAKPFAKPSGWLSWD